MMSRRKRALSNNGTFTAEHIWRIDDETYIGNVKNADTLKSFQSMFEMHDLQWVILLYPNGAKDKYKGYINLHLQLVELPEKTSKIEIYYKMRITELNTEFESTAELSKKTYFCQWSPFLLKRYALKKINKACTIVMEIGITKMYDLNNKLYISRDCIPMKKMISEPQPPSLTTDGQIKNINVMNKIHIKQSSSENNIPFQTGLINIDEDDDDDNNNDEGDDILCDDEEKQQLLELKIDNISNNNVSRKLTAVSTLDVKVEIINDLLQIHDAKFLSLTKEIKEMQEMIYQLNDKLECLNEEKKNENVISPMLIPEISPMHSPIMKGLHKLSTSTMNDDEIGMNQYKIGMNRDNVKNWLETNCLLPQYIEKFLENGIEDLSIVQLLTIKELKDLGITKMGHKLKILHEIEQLKLKN